MCESLYYKRYRGYDTNRFLDGAGENMRDVLRKNRNKKVKMIFRCNMERKKSEEVKPSAFHSDIDINLDGTDVEELYNTMEERIMKK